MGMVLGDDVVFDLVINICHDESMRIYALVFGGLIVSLALGFLVWFFGEKVLLFLAAYELRREVAGMQQLAKTGSVTACQGSNDFSYGDLLGWQLRFVSEDSYVVEPVCSMGKGPAVLEKHLSHGVVRLWGSGIFMASELSGEQSGDAWVHLSLGEHQVVVGWIGHTAKVDWEVDAYEVGGDAPAQGMCSDWGFSCCHDGRQEGDGYQVWTADCPNRCYQTCIQYPVVTFFNTLPQMDPRSRNVVIYQSSPVVEFGFMVESDMALSAVQIDFGDGVKSEPLPLKTPSVAHAYECLEAQCVYEARLMAAPGSSVELVESALNQVSVVVVADRP